MDDRLPYHAMLHPDGTHLFPDNEDDARDMAEDGATPVYPQEFPFDLDGLGVLRARVTVTFEVRSVEPLDITENCLWNWVADRMGRVTDNGPYGFYRSGTEGSSLEIDFGDQHVGPVEWLDGSAPEHGFHCGDCRIPKDPQAGPCLRMVPWGTGERQCQSDDAQHHDACWHRVALRAVLLSDAVAE